MLRGLAVDAVEAVEAVEAPSGLTDAPLAPGAQT